MSDKLGDLAFDGAAALVDDFRFGERVELELEQRETGFHVKRIWPDDPRFVPPHDIPQSAPALEQTAASRIAAALVRIPESLDFRVVRLESDLIVRGDDDAFAYGYQVEICFRSVDYVELPMGWEGKTFALAHQTERRYLAGRCELLGTTAAIRIVDANRQIFFVTCNDVEVAVKAG
ncbi:MAG: hypothetical protein QM784_28115 [Polyangiaceae bacterium]